MAQFFKTFIVCLILALGFIGYKYFSNESYNKDLTAPKDSPYTFEKEVPQKVETPKEEKNPEVEKYTHTCYFYSPTGNLIPVKRDVAVQQDLEGAILILLKGPTIKETQRGIYSEIPNNVNLLSVKRKGNSIIVDLSSTFETGGGSNSIENRVKQLSKTVKTIEPKKDVYLYLNGKQVEYLGGEGVYIKQPLN